MIRQTTLRPAGCTTNDQAAPRPHQLTELAALLTRRPQLRELVQQLTDEETTCVCEAFAVLAAEQQVCTSTVALDLRIWQLASELGGRAVSLGRVREVRRSVQRRGGLAIEVAGVQVLPVEGSLNGGTSGPDLSGRPAGQVDGHAGAGGRRGGGCGEVRMVGERRDGDDGCVGLDVAEGGDVGECGGDGHSRRG